MSAIDRSTLNRRQLIQAAGGALAAIGLGGSSAAMASPHWTAPDGALPSARTRVGLVFCAGFGKASAERTNLVRSILTTACPRIDFTTRTVHDAVEAYSLLKDTSGLDGYVVWSLGHQPDPVRAFTQSDRPVVVAYDAVDGSAGR